MPGLLRHVMGRGFEKKDILELLTTSQKVEIAEFVFNDFNKIETVNASVSCFLRDRQLLI